MMAAVAGTREDACAELEDQVHLTLRGMLLDMGKVTLMAHMSRTSDVKPGKVNHQYVFFRFDRCKPFPVRKLNKRVAIVCTATMLDGMGLVLCSNEMCCMLQPTEILDLYYAWRKKVARHVVRYCLSRRYHKDVIRFLLNFMVQQFCTPTRQLQHFMVMADQLSRTPNKA